YLLNCAVETSDSVYSILAALKTSSPFIRRSFFFFFFKQKTAYEIGLGIPAEPLFRSHQSFQATAGFRDYAPNAYSSSNGWSVFYQIGRAVQQECRDRSRMPSSA